MITLVILYILVLQTFSTKIIDERWVCNIKKSCLDCLMLSHCTWCEKESKCFSKQLPGREEYCKDNATLYEDNGMSFEDNAMCICLANELPSNCIPPDATDGQECFGRGECKCGRCFCNENPDPNHPSKKILGEYCEFDNFSCDGPGCNEGPYLINATGDETNIE